MIGGFSLVLSDGRAAFLTATTKAYDPNSAQGIWAPNIDDATCSSVNHKYRLLSFGRKNAETSVFSVDDQTGGLQPLFSLKLSSKDFPGRLANSSSLGHNGNSIHWPSVGNPSSLIESHLLYFPVQIDINVNLLFSKFTHHKSHV